MTSPSLWNEIKQQQQQQRVTRSSVAALLSNSIMASGGGGGVARDDRDGGPRGDSDVYTEFAHWLAKASIAQHTASDLDGEAARDLRYGDGSSEAVEAALSLLEQFGELSLNHLEELREHIDGARRKNHPEDSASVEAAMTNWEREWSTWRLLLAMYQERVAQKKEPISIDVDDDDDASTPAASSLATDVQMIGALFAPGSSHGALREHVIVKNWLQEVASGFQPVGPRTGYWFYTSRYHHGLSAASAMSDPDAAKIVHTLDPDAPSREKRSLAPEDEANGIWDQEFDKALVRTLYEYLRRGQFNQAMELCRKSDQSWRAASISGSTLYSDESLDRGSEDDVDDEDHSMMPPAKRQKGPEGNPRRLLWKSMCRQLSKNMLMVSQSWEDYLFTYYNAMIETELDKHLAKRHVKYQEIVKTWTPAEIFERLSKSDQPDIRAASVEPFHYVQSLVIQNQLDMLVDTLSNNFTQLNDFDEHMQHVLRFAAHWVIVMRQLNALPRQDTAGDRIIKCYVDLLIAVKKNQLVAQYCALLPTSLQIPAYASFLRTLERVTREERYQYLQRARDHRMDVQAITVQVVQMILEAYKSETDACLMFGSKSVNIALIHSAVEENDQEQIRALEWLFFEPNQSRDAIIQASHLARRFLVLGKLNAVKALLDSIPSDIRAAHSADQVIDQTDALSVAVREVTGYTNLCLFEEKFAEWALLTKESRAVGNNKSEYDLLVKVRTLVNDMEMLANQLLITTWLVLDIEESQLDPYSPSVEQRRQECGKVRERYLTELTIQLYMILYESESILPGSMRKSLNLSHLVANAEYGLYTEFVRAGRMAELLELLRRSAVALSSSNTTITSL
ncbi:nuclear pore protein 84/107 [Syncephalis pseudoplumigaleata]|uniref:Nuclear pore complex protein n=1 Tax=Syncephalis pseudoplumigaleata TaxID=1712513 RepID=A0A4P9Z810_9FUNG|nr:nuclear pore protein 84/107 [Syncephalis pseudoplumigaleata]|eukprot:RKP27870.1 nuclear pore protein 84/107 [Syncephalis pseudoplumigaleata]